MSRTGGSKKVVVYTWPYQWVYEPAYAALSDIKKTGSFDIRFEFRGSGTQNFSTDIQVRNALTGASDDELAIALCEPPDFGRENFVHDERKYRIIPLLWRLPVWLFGHTSLRAKLQPNENSMSRSSPRVINGVIPPSAALIRSLFENDSFIVFHYHQSDTTAGREGTRLLNALKVNADTYCTLPQHYDKFLNDVKSSSPFVRLAVSYTPLHFIREDIAPLFEVAGVRDRVSAFIFRENDFTRGSSGADQLFQELETRLKGHLLRLYASTDPYEQALQLINRNPEYPTPPPDWSRPGPDRATLITAFVRRGCYFPYESMDANLTDRFFWIAEEHARACNAIVAVGLPRALQRSLSSGVNWWAVAASERIDVLMTTEYEADLKPNTTKPLLAEFMLHTSDHVPTNAQSDSALRHTMISCTLGTTKLEDVAWDVGTQHSDIISKTLSQAPVFRCEKYGDPRECAKQSTSFPCRACMFMGGEVALAWQIHAYLTDRNCGAATLKEVFDACGIDQRFRGSPFQWYDVKPVCDLFVTSFRGSSASVKTPIGLFPMQYKWPPLRLASSIAICLGTCEVQTAASGADWSAGTLNKLQLLLAAERQEGAGATLSGVHAWKATPWSTNGTNHLWTSPPSYRVNKTSGEPEWLSDAAPEFKKPLNDFLTSNGLQFCIVALYDATPRKGALC